MHMVIKKEIKQYSNRRQININKNELVGQEEVYIYTESERLQQNTTVSDITKSLQTIAENQVSVADYQSKIDKKEKELIRYDAVLKDVISQYNNLIDDVENTSWKDAILNRFKRILDNHEKISRIDTIKAIETTIKYDATAENDDTSDDDVASDDADSQ